MENRYDIEIADNNFIDMSNPNSRTLCYRMNYKDLKTGKYDDKVHNPFIVYILHAKNYDGKDYLYIGKSKNGILNRPKSHERADIDWDMCYVLTQFKERTILNDGTIQYLEDQLTRKARETNCYNIETHQTTRDTANTTDKRNCDLFLEEAIEMLYILGLDLRTIRSMVMDKQIVGTQELLVNQLFSGGYLSMGDNLGHDITNIIKDDSGIFNLYIAPGGNNMQDKHDVGTVLFVKNDIRPYVVEVIAMATELKPYANESFTYNGKTYKDLYRGNQFNGKLETNIDVLVNYRTTNVQIPTQPLYIGVKGFVNDPDVELIDNNGTRLTNTSMRSYHKEDSDLYKQFKAIIDKTIWKPLDAEEIYQRFNKYECFKIQYERFMSRIGLTQQKSLNHFIDNNKTVWCMHGLDEDLFLKQNQLNIGWHEMGDLSLLPNDKTEFKEKYVQVYPKATIGNISNCVTMLYKFKYEMKLDDMVAFAYQNTIHIGMVIGDYTYVPNEHFPHRREVKWLKHIPRNQFSQDIRYSMRSGLTLFELKKYGQEIIDKIDDNAQVINQPKRKNRSPSTFEMLGISVGSELEYINNPSIKVWTVDNKNKVRHSDGTVLTISPMVCYIEGRDFPVNGNKCFSYNGKSLWDIRIELEA